MRIGYDEECGSVVIVGGGVFPACTLRAVMQADGKIRVHSLAELAELYCDWFRLQDLDGRTFATPEDAKSYLDGVLARRASPPASISTGTGHPPDAIGYAGDLYIDAVSGDFYRKEQ